MGWFDFFKKVPKNEIVESKKFVKKIVFSDIWDWIKEKEMENKSSEKNIFFLVQEKIDVFVNEIEEKIDILENVDLKQKKVEGRIKFVVNESRIKYIESLRNFKNNLKRLEQNQLDKFISDVNKIFLEFNKSSYKNYEKTTILIGKEMASLKDSLKNFSGNLMKIFEDGRKFIDLLNKIHSIKSVLKQIEDIEKKINMIDEKLISSEEKINEKEGEREKILDKIEEIKKSENYIENLKIREKIRLFKMELEKDISILKQFIDFKELANFFHIFKERMNIVKNHRENFQTNFRKDYGASIIDLLNESNTNNESISEKIKQIRDKNEEIIRNQLEIKKDETEGLYLEITKIVQEIEKLKSDKSVGGKRYIKIKVNREKLGDMVKENIGEMGVEVEI